MSNKQLVWFGPPYSYSGYALHNRAMIFSLLNQGWDIRLIPSEHSIPDGLIGKDILQGLVKNKNIDPENNICLNLIPPPAVPYYGLYTILFTTLESDTVHEGFRRRCNQFDEVWVPCKWNYRTMLKDGYPRKNLFYCQEGVNTKLWNHFVTPHPKYKSHDFTFFYNGDWSYRKGVDILLRAYCKAFAPTDNVRLLLMTNYQGNGEEASRQAIGTEIRHICDKYKLYRLPKIEFIYGHLPDRELPQLYRCADAYVCPTRGEAWGLPIIQAMACGVPPIIPKLGGHRDYTNADNSFLANVDGFDTIHDKVELHVDFYWYQKFVFTNVDHFAKLMKYAFSRRDETRLKGRIAQEFVRTRFSWSISGAIANKRLEKIYETKYRKRLHTSARLQTCRH